MIEQLSFLDTKIDLMTIKQASIWATNHLNKQVTPSNISYLIQYGRIKKNGENGSTLVSKKELVEYYDSFYGKREIEWKNQLGNDLNWHLSFDYLKETDTTKHVHRLHPYKGKFIPQLVEYFLDGHTDEFKRDIFFHKGDVILDVFCGSGTTLVQANELGLHGIGVDISAFNSLISNVKVSHFDLNNVRIEIDKISKALRRFLADSHTIEFDQKLTHELSAFNAAYFPSPDFKRKVAQKAIDEEKYGSEKISLFLPIYENLVGHYNIKLRQSSDNTFLDKWYLEHIRSEINFVFALIKKIENVETKKIISVILSRTIRSCRATTHADLSTLKEPITAPYYCAKHGKICKPLFSVQSWWETYAKDSLERLVQFNKLRTNTFQLCLTGDSRTIDIETVVRERNSNFAELIASKKIKGVFSSPPYVGLIDYHEQHAYAYDLFGFERRDEFEIGRLFYGQGKAAKEKYVSGIADVLNNAKRFLADDYDVFLVSNDKYNLYPSIADKAGMKIINRYKRPVLNRTEKDKGAYSEIIFHLKAL
jgi:SAM-dependent methyltransferase